MNPEHVALAQARVDAIARGDKALGREIYHQLISYGYHPEFIDRGGLLETPEDGVLDEVETADDKPKRRKA